MKSRLLCSMLLTLSVSMSGAENIMPEKRIYLLDLSGSMIGQGSVRTDNVLDKMKSDLEATVDWTSLPTDFVFIPFTDRVMPEFGGTDTKKRELMTEIFAIKPGVGNTDIASAWECALTKLDSTKVNYIFLLTDGYHNRGISKAGLNSLVKSWPQSTGRCDAEAYFVSLSPKYRTSEIARIFDETDKMSVVETMNICRQAFDVEPTERQSDNTIAVVSDATDKSCSLLWLWILLAIVLTALIIWAIVYWWPKISAVFARMIPMSKPVSGQSPKPGPGPAQKNKPDKSDKDEDKEDKCVHFLPWVGKNYKQGIYGRRVLVLGESHYCARQEDDTPYVTRKVIADLLDPNGEHEAYKNTYTKFERALAGKVLDWQEKAELWNSIIFYNYVQIPMTGPRISPTVEEFKDSAQAFFEVLDRYRPDCVIVWGKRLYNNLPHVGYQGPELRLQDGTCLETWVYSIADGQSVQVLPIQHPSTGFSWDFWHEAIKQYLAFK